MKSLVLLSLVSLISAISANGQSILRIGGNNAPPYRILDSDAPSGIYIDTMNLIAKKIGMRPEYSEMPMVRALKSMELGTIDAMLGPNMTPDREAYMVFVMDTPFPVENKGIYTVIDRSEIADYADLYGKRIGVLKGAKYFDRFDTDGSLTKIDLVDYESGFRMLEANRIDVVICPELQADYIVGSMGLRVKKNIFSFPGKPSYIAVSKSSAIGIEMVPAIMEAMKQLQSEGAIDSILRKYR